MSIAQNMKITCKSFQFDTYYLSSKYRVQGGDPRKYCRVPIDDIPDADNIFELLRDAVNFICKIILFDMKCVDKFLIFLAVAFDRGDPVLVYSDRGVSRSAAVVVAFISFQMRMNSQVSFIWIIEEIAECFLFRICRML
jgi:hypothetical protein